MNTHGLDLSRAEWRKGSRSHGNGECVEVARGLRGVVAARDSKKPEGPGLILAPDAWRLLTAAVKTGQSDLA